MIKLDYVNITYVNRDSVAYVNLVHVGYMNSVKVDNFYEFLYVLIACRYMDLWEDNFNEMYDDLERDFDAMNDSVKHDINATNDDVELGIVDLADVFTTIMIFDTRDALLR